MIIEIFCIGLRIGNPCCSKQQVINVVGNEVQVDGMLVLSGTSCGVYV